MDSTGMLSGLSPAILRQIQWSAHGLVPVISQNPQGQGWLSRTNYFLQTESHATSPDRQSGGSDL